MKPYISIHQNSVSIFKEAGFEIYNVSLSECEKTDQILLHINWTGNDDADACHFHKLKYAEGGKCESYSDGKICTDIYFIELKAEVPEGLKGEDAPDWMLAATMSIGIDFEGEASTNYSILYTTFAKREATMCFAKYGDWKRFKQIQFYKELDPYTKGDL